MKSFIFGERVTEFARSPRIWNALFKEFDLNGSMSPIDADVKTINQAVLNASSTSSKICGLIAAPLKDHMIWFNSFSAETVRIARAANYFECENGELSFVENFDGKAAVQSILTHMPEAKTTLKHVSIIGTGPVARIIAAELMNLLEIDAEIVFFSRTLNDIDRKSKISNLNTVYPLEFFEFQTRMTDLVINCSPIGSPRLPGTPITESQIYGLRKNAAYFDVNYGQETPLGVQICLRSGRTAFDGTEMNRLQAAMAFLFATKIQYDLSDVVRRIENIS